MALLQVSADPLYWRADYSSATQSEYASGSPHPIHCLVSIGSLQVPSEYMCDNHRLLIFNLPPSVGFIAQNKLDLVSVSKILCARRSD